MATAAGPSVLFFSRSGPVSAAYEEQLPAGWRFAALSDDPDMEEQRRLIADADVLIHTDTPITRDHLVGQPRLRLVQRQGVGVDALDLGLLAEHGIAVAICPDGTPEAVAEHAVMLMLAAGRHLLHLHRDVVDRKLWPKWDYRQRSIGLAGARVGLVGFGRIGQATAERVLAFGSEVTVHRRPGRPMPDGWQDRVQVVSSLEELFETSDIVSLHCPLNDQTRGLVTQDLLDRMGPYSVLVNTARGAVIDEPALIGALQRGRPMAAGLDCLSIEPPPADHPLLALDNVVLTPHMAAGTRMTQSVKARSVYANISRFWSGEEPAHRVI